MEDQNLITAFDTLHTTNRLQILKILFSRLPETIRPYLAVYIKIKELNCTINLYAPQMNHNIPQNFSFDFVRELFKPDDEHLGFLCKSALPYCTPSEKDFIQNIIHMISTYQSYQNIMEMMKLLDLDGLQHTQKTGQPDQNTNSFDQLFQMLGGGMSAEQKNIFDMFAANIGTDENNPIKESADSENNNHFKEETPNDPKSGMDAG